MRHLMSPLDFSVEELDKLLTLANDIEKNPEKYAHACDGKKLATLFYEPSTRTRLSFEAAMMNLGGNVLGFSSADSSSAAKGESVADTIRVTSCYADICAMRHPKEGAPLVASMSSSIPVINAGDGGHQHPTQTLTDLLTIRSLKGRLDNLTIGLCGDLKFGRTVHSLIEALVRYENVKFVLISPEELRVRGNVLGFSSADSSSAAKGESVADTIRVTSCYADICAMRHPKEGAPLVASMSSSIPVINAGDGGHQHPTQTLTDLLTIRSLKGRLDNLTIGLCGDLKFGRTVHSLIEALVRYENVKFVLISPEELRVPSYIREDVLSRNDIEFQEVERLEDALPQLDILYMTRVQKERFFNEEDYVRMKDFYILDKQKMELAKEDMYILHPLPRVNEIAVEVDSDPRAAYFKQAQYGVYVRMALILTLLEVDVSC